MLLSDDRHINLPFVFLTLTLSRWPGNWIIRASHDTAFNAQVVEYPIIKYTYETLVLHSLVGIANKNTIS